MLDTPFVTAGAFNFCYIFFFFLKWSGNNIYPCFYRVSSSISVTLRISCKLKLIYSCSAILATSFFIRLRSFLKCFILRMYCFERIILTLSLLAFCSLIIIEGTVDFSFIYGLVRLLVYSSIT